MKTQIRSLPTRPRGYSRHLAVDWTRAVPIEFDGARVERNRWAAREKFTRQKS